MTQLIKINAVDYGLEESKAQQISDMFKPMLDKMTELEIQYNEVIKRPIDFETIQMAKDLLRVYVKVRSGTADIHKELKAYYLHGGRFVDGWKNAQLAASCGNEEKLKSIVNHAVNIENERVIKLQEERSNDLLKYVEYIPSELGVMDADVWKNYLSGVILNYNAQKEAEAKAEKERLEAIEKEKAEQERIRKENEQLKQEAIKAEEIRVAEEKERIKEEKARQAKAEAERKEREEKERKEREAHDAAMKKEREERGRVEAELKAKAEAERKRIQDEEAKIQAELNKGDKDKVADLISDLKVIGEKYTFKSKANQAMYLDVRKLLYKVIDHINQVR